VKHTAEAPEDQLLAASKLACFGPGWSNEPNAAVGQLIETVFE